MVSDGDSITAGFGGVKPYPGSITFSSPWRVINVATFNQTLANDLANAPTAVDVWFRTGGKNLSVIWAGTNDISDSGTSPADTYALLVSYCNARKAKGFKCVVATMLSRVNNDAGKNAYNALILANWPTFADGVVDFSGTPLGVDGGYANTTYFLNGGIHPNQFATDTIIDPAFQSVISGLYP